MWTNSVLGGIGVEIWQDASYFGEFKNGQKEGIGRYIWKNKSLNGFGVYYFSDGRKYCGEWNNNYMEGFGIYLWNNKKKYYGFFKKGVKHGFGIFYLLNDKFLIGFWKEGKQNGFVKHINGDTILYGVFKDGKKEKVFENENDFWNSFIDIKNLKYKSFFEMDKNSVYNYINSCEE